MDTLSKQIPAINVLHFTRMWDVFTSDQISFDRVIDVSKRSVGVVEFRNKLDSHRSAALDASLHANNEEYVMEQALSYLAATEYLAAHTQDLKAGWFGKIRIHSKWASALSAPGPFGGAPQFKTAKGIVCEDQALMLLRYIAAAWRQIQRKLETICPEQQQQAGASFAATPEAAVDTTAAGECITLLRKAAGAAACFAGTLWFRVTDAVGPAAPAVPEYRRWLGGVLTSIFMAQAHYVMAYLSFSQEKWLLAAKLFVGAAGDFDGAAAVLTQVEGEGQSVHREFKAFVQLYAVLARARARTCMVRKLLAEREAGRASTAAKHAQNELAQGGHLLHDLGRARRDWEAVFAAMEGEAAAVWELCEKERKYVYSQQVSEDAPADVPEGARPLTPLDFSLPEKDFALQFERV